MADCETTAATGERGESVMGKRMQKSKGWGSVFLNSTLSALCFVCGVSACAWAIHGPQALLSALLGGGAVLFFSAFSLGLIWITESKRPQWSIPAFMLGFAVKLVAIGFMMVMVTAPGWIEPGWAIFTAAAVVLIFQAVEILSFTRLRLTYSTEI